MDFFSEYYLWFLIGGIILVMALIGYIADKTDFGRKEVAPIQKQKESKKEKNKKQEEKNNNVITEPTVTYEEPQQPIQTNEENVASDNVNEISMTPVEEVNEEYIVENGADDINLSANISDEDIEIKEVTDDSTFALNNDLSSFAAAEFMSPIGSADLVDNTVSEVIGENISVDSVNTPVEQGIAEEIITEDIDEDIWKF